MPADARDERVVLAVALQRPGVVETDAEQAAGSMAPRYQVAEVDVGDSNTQASTAMRSVQVGRLNLRLMLERDASEGYATLGVARIVERRADNKLVLDAQYVPPMLHAPAPRRSSTATCASCAGCCTSAARRWRRALAQPGRGGVAEIADFLLLQAVNRSQPLFAHLQQRCRCCTRERLLRRCA